MKNKLMILAAIFAFSFTSVSFSGLLDKKVELSTLPPIVQEAINRYAEDGKIESIEEERSKGDLAIYEVEVKKPDGSELEFKIDGNGKLIELERE